VEKFYYDNSSHYWIMLDKSFGTKSDSITVSIPDSIYTEGIYSGVLRFSYRDSEDNLSYEYVNVSLFVESGVDVGSQSVEQGEGGSFGIPITLYSTDSLLGFTVPLKYETGQPENVYLDSVVIPDQSKGPIAVAYLDVANQGFIIHRPIAEPPLPDSTDIEIAIAYFTVTPDASTEVININTETMEYDGTVYSYEFVDVSGTPSTPTYEGGGQIIVEETVYPPEMIQPLDSETDAPRPLEFIWESLESADEYELQISSTPDFGYHDLSFNNTMIDTFYTLGEGLVEYAYYFWRVRCHAAGKWSNWSEIRNFVTGKDWVESDINLVNDNSLPKEFRLKHNYPNPFNPSTTIAFALPRACDNVRLEIFNILGQKVNTLVNESLSAGNYITRWDGDDAGGQPVSTGIYFYRLTAGEFVQSKKMLLLK
jgi:hypothetical protein